MSFDWMTPTAHRNPTRERERRLAMVRRALTERAGLYYRLGLSQKQAARRLTTYLDWDFEVGTGGRPQGLSDTAIRKLVDETYARRPSH